MTKTRAERELYYGGDKPDLVKMCLECKWPDCRNCIASMTREERKEIIDNKHERKRRKKRKHNTGGKP